MNGSTGTRQIVFRPEDSQTSARQGRAPTWAGGTGLSGRKSGPAAIMPLVRSNHRKSLFVIDRSLVTSLSREPPIPGLRPPKPGSDLGWWNRPLRPEIRASRNNASRSIQSSQVIVRDRQVSCYSALCRHEMNGSTGTRQIVFRPEGSVLPAQVVARLGGRNYGKRAPQTFLRSCNHRKGCSSQRKTRIM